MKTVILFDGFPRTIAQAEGMKDNNIDIEYVLELVVPDEAIITRMSGRRVHAASGRSYHIEFNPPEKDGLDDVTGEPLVQRDDDKEETVRKRLDVYHDQTKPLVSYYQDWAANGESKTPVYISIEGVGDVKEISAAIDKALK